MQEVNLDKLKEHILRPYTEGDLIPLLLFLGRMSFHRAKSLLNLMCAGMESELITPTDLLRLSRFSKDINHLCGLHAPMQKMGLNGFVIRLLHSPTVFKLIPHLEDYTHELSQYFWSLDLTPISRYSFRTKHLWRFQPRQRHSHPEIIKLRELELKQALREPVPSFYPFLTSNPTNEHEIILQVHNAVPSGIPQQFRQDICQDLLVAVLDGKVKRENLQDHVQEFIKRTYRQFGKYSSPLSLDRPISFEDNRTLSDMIADPNAEAEIYACESSL